MPDESCRKCGGLLVDLTLCAKCKGPLQFICRICAHRTIPRIHQSICFRLDTSELSRPEIHVFHHLT